MPKLKLDGNSISHKQKTQPPKTDSTIAPRQNHRFSLMNVSSSSSSWLLDTRKGTIEIENKVPIYFLVVQKAYRSMTLGCRGTHRISGGTTGELVLKPAISLKKSWGGYRRRTTPNCSASVVKSVWTVTFKEMCFAGNDFAQHGDTRWWYSCILLCTISTRA